MGSSFLCKGLVLYPVRIIEVHEALNLGEEERNLHRVPKVIGYWYVPNVSPFTGQEVGLEVSSL